MYYHASSIGTIKQLEPRIQEEYDRADDHPEYRHFLKGNFPDLIHE